MFNTIYTLQKNTKKQFKCNKRRHTNNCMTRCPLHKEIELHDAYWKTSLKSIHQCKVYLLSSRKKVKQNIIHDGHVELKVQVKRIFLELQPNEIRKAGRRQSCITKKKCCHLQN